MKPFQPEFIFVDEASLDDPVAAGMLERFRDVPFEILRDGAAPPVELQKQGGSTISRGKRTVYLRRNRGKFVERCPGTMNTHICCNYHVANIIVNCHLDCTYCFLQSYLTERYLTVFTNVGEFLDEIGRIDREHRGSEPLRIGTGEVADSLAMDELTGISRELVPYFAGLGNVLLELKTKGNYVDNLLGLEPNGRTVIAWSLNTPEMIASEEHKCSSLEQRLDAARRCRDAGYRLAFHFDPIIEYAGWEEAYPAVVDRIYEYVGPGDVMWISLGMLRFTPSGRDTIIRRFPNTGIVYGEQVQCADGKLRYLQPVRTRMYRRMLDRIRTHDDSAYVYLCMESPAVWKRVFGENSRAEQCVTTF